MKSSGSMGAAIMSVLLFVATADTTHATVIDFNEMDNNDIGSTEFPLNTTLDFGDYRASSVRGQYLGYQAYFANRDDTSCC